MKTLSLDAVRGLAPHLGPLLDKVGGCASSEWTRVARLSELPLQTTRTLPGPLPVIADTVSVTRILPNIITKMNLPVMGPDGQPMSELMKRQPFASIIHSIFSACGMWKSGRSPEVTSRQ